VSEWGDPLVGDDAVRERERRRAEREARRAEREARRRKTRGALGERVSGLARANRLTRGGARGSVPGSRSPVHRRRRLAALGALAAAVLVVVVAAVVIHRGSDGEGATAAKPAAPAKKITIPEGYDRRQTADVAAKAGVRGDYMKASESFKGFNPARYGDQHPTSLEGFLFPATYELPRHPTADDLVVRQLDAFKQYISGVSMGYARSKNLTTYDVLTIASMIEREVQVPKERKLVAAVVYNRLHAGMPLQIDATVRYATENFTEPLTQSELQVDSPYNTYANPGLPPGPIGNPGLASIEAAAHPARVPFLYYVVKPGTCPAKHTFATTEAEFERAKAAYDRARAEAGGQSPTCPG
jgi:UPF0755 protein